MPSIIITNVRNVSVNGSPVGALVNAFQEAQDPVAVQLALESFFDNVESAHAAAIAAKDADQAAAVEAAKLAIQVNLDGIVAEAEPRFAAVMAAYPDDADVIGLGMALAKAKGHTTAARRAKIEADLAAAQAAAAAHAAALAALA
jgi:hypothetical protein